MCLAWLTDTYTRSTDSWPGILLAQSAELVTTQASNWAYRLACSRPFRRSVLLGSRLRRYWRVTTKDGIMIIAVAVTQTCISQRPTTAVQPVINWCGNDATSCASESNLLDWLCDRRSGYVWCWGWLKRSRTAVVFAVCRWTGQWLRT